MAACVICGAPTPAEACVACSARMTRWLEAIPNLWSRLGTNIAQGRASEPLRAGRKRGESSAPIRTDVSSLLDVRGDESVVYRLNRWTLWLRALRQTPATDLWESPDVRELRGELGWLVEQPEIVRIYEDLRSMHQQMNEALGDRGSGWGTCHAQVEGRVCSGPLWPEGDEIRCGWCGALGPHQQWWVTIPWAADLVGRTEPTLRAWQASGDLPSVCLRANGRLLVDALWASRLAATRQTRRRRATRSALPDRALHERL